MISHCNSEDSRTIIVYSNVVTSGQTATCAKSEDLPGQLKKIMLKYINRLHYFVPNVLAVIVPDMAILCHSAKIHSPDTELCFQSVSNF